MFVLYIVDANLAFDNLGDSGNLIRRKNERKLLSTFSYLPRIRNEKC